MATAVKILKAGGVIAFPTETVFGIGALLDKPKAINRIYKIKRRPRNKPLQVLVASLTQARTLGIFNARALKLAKKYWPGPLTLVVCKTRGSGNIGLRIPKHKTIIELIRKCGPIAASSANAAGEKPGMSIKEVKKYLHGLDYYLPGRVKTGKASKVIEATNKLKVLRP